jgi:hypothetical protein
MLADVIADNLPDGLGELWTLGRRLHRLTTAAAGVAFVGVVWWLMAGYFSALY